MLLKRSHQWMITPYYLKATQNKENCQLRMRNVCSILETVQHRVKRFVWTAVDLPKTYTAHAHVKVKSTYLDFTVSHFCLLIVLSPQKHVIVRLSSWKSRVFGGFSYPVQLPVERKNSYLYATKFTPDNIYCN